MGGCNVGCIGKSTVMCVVGGKHALVEEVKNIYVPVHNITCSFF